MRSNLQTTTKLLGSLKLPSYFCYAPKQQLKIQEKLLLRSTFSGVHKNTKNSETVA